ncbi:ArpU family phage packaging/lysis transcriptional regulator [Sporosarcina obsidiansis]|uniref:ArpU family phage packaging/lysis transcriptional regulator n=1 Tax=Sporosarcina obsidiansis TaxID=2660748 RepID=UPI00129AFE07|nr:ArpU family phage packaging/lysis transcriptional regulator [Sporosarcina obsidiansis]
MFFDGFTREVDKRKTKAAVEKALERYRMFTLQVSLDKQPSITANYSLTSTSNHLPSSSTERAAIKNVQYERDRIEYLEWISSAVNRLSEIERTIIYRRYLRKYEQFDYEIYNELNMSERSYYRLKAKLFINLAIALKIEVYKEEVHDP